jgi:hypothetical protein
MSATVMAVMLAGDEEEGAHLEDGPSVLTRRCWARGFVLLVAEEQHVCFASVVGVLVATGEYGRCRNQV